MAAKIKETLNVDAELVKSSGGVYDVKVNDQIVYSKKANDNQFPESDQSVVDAINSLA